MPYNIIQGIWEHLRGVEDTFEAIYHHFGPLPAKCDTTMCKVKIPKNCPKSPFSTKNHDFFKVGIRARMADIWPEICIWDVLDPF